MTVLPAFEQAGQSFCVPSMALILLVQVRKSSNMGTGYEKSPHFAGIEKIL